jgi:hypothetical protein
MFMQKSFLAILATAGSILIFSTSGAISGTYPFGDEPYTLNWGYYPETQSGCWRWNWQQHGWDDYCAVYVHPKAYMYPRSSRVVLRSKG